MIYTCIKVLFVLAALFDDYRRVGVKEREFLAAKNSPLISLLFLNSLKALTALSL